MQTNIVAAPQPLEKDQWHCLMEGDIFSLMPGKYIYRVHVKEDDQTLRWFSLSLTGIHLLFSNNRAQSDWLCMNLYIYLTSLRKGLIYWCWMHLFKVNICTVCFFNTFKFGFILVWNTFFNLKWFLMDTMKCYSVFLLNAVTLWKWNWLQMFHIDFNYRPSWIFSPSWIFKYIHACSLIILCHLKIAPFIKASHLSHLSIFPLDMILSVWLNVFILTFSLKTDLWPQGSDQRTLLLSFSIMSTLGSNGHVQNGCSDNTQMINKW